MLTRASFRVCSSSSSRGRRNAINRKSSLFVTAGLLLLLLLVNSSTAFRIARTPFAFCLATTRQSSRSSFSGSITCDILRAKQKDDPDESDNDDGEVRDQDRNDQNMIMDDVSWRVEKIRLEEANTRNFLKRRPWKLPYEQARTWVQANWGIDTEEEFNDLVENGNLRTPYIPKRPVEYYTRTKDWISWDHFLTGTLESSNTTSSSSSSSGDIKPPTGVFD